MCSLSFLVWYFPPSPTRSRDRSPEPASTEAESGHLGATTFISAAGLPTWRCCLPGMCRYRGAMITPDDVRGIAGKLPGAYEQPTYDQAPSWRTKPRMFAWIRDDPAALVVWVESEEDKLAMIAAHPGTFFTTPHYDGQPIVLVSMAEVGKDETRELIVESWRLRAPRKLLRDWDAERSGDGRPES